VVRRESAALPLVALQSSARRTAHLHAHIDLMRAVCACDIGLASRCGQTSDRSRACQSVTSSVDAKAQRERADVNPRFTSSDVRSSRPRHGWGEWRGRGHCLRLQ